MTAIPGEGHPSPPGAVLRRERTPHPHVQGQEERTEGLLQGPDRRTLQRLTVDDQQLISVDYSLIYTQILNTVYV